MSFSLLHASPSMVYSRCFSGRFLFLFSYEVHLWFPASWWSWPNLFNAWTELKYRFRNKNTVIQQIASTYGRTISTVYGIRRYWAVYQLDITVLVLIFQTHEEQLKNVYTAKVSFLPTSFQSVTRIFRFFIRFLRNCSPTPLLSQHFAFIAK